MRKNSWDHKDPAFHFKQEMICIAVTGAMFASFSFNLFWLAGVAAFTVFFLIRTALAAVRAASKDSDQVS